MYITRYLNIPSGVLSVTSPVESVVAPRAAATVDPVSGVSTQTAVRRIETM